jgi:phosphohistidine swiveling domain-containing protein
LTIAQTADLQRQLDDINEIRRGQQSQITGNALNLHYTKLDLADLVVEVAGKVSTAEFNEQLLTRATVSSLVAGLATKENKLDTFTALDVASVVSGALTAGATVINSGNNDVPFIVGSDESYLRVKFGHHIDVYSRDGVGRDLNLCNHTGSSVRVGAKLSIGQPPNNFQFSCAGAGSFTSFVEATKYNLVSDARIKTNVQPASLEECTRLTLTVRPQTYNLKATGEAHVGYLANDFDREARDGFRCVMGESGDADGPLLALDMMRVIPILHGALLSALARIEALENRLT